MKSRTIKRVVASGTALAATTLALAQQPPDDNTEDLGEVVVTGYRASLQSSLAVKRNSELVVDAIAGGDIGALPDVTIAVARRSPGDRL